MSVFTLSREVDGTSHDLWRSIDGLSTSSLDNPLDEERSRDCLEGEYKVIFIIILNCLTYLDSSNQIQKKFCKPRGPQQTYYCIELIIVDGDA